MRGRFVLLVLLLALLPLASPRAQVSRDDLSHVGLLDRRGAMLPDVGLQRHNGQIVQLREAIGAGPALVLFVDYTCTTLCGVTLGAVTRSLETLPRDAYRVLVVGLDPKDGLAEVEAFRAARLEQSPLVADIELLRGGPATIAALTRAAGFILAYDRARDQFAHPAAVLVLTAEGRVSRALDALALTPHDMRLALTEAGEGRTGSVADRLILLCYGWDAATGIYTLQIRSLLMLGGLVTVLAIATALAVLRQRERTAGRRGHHG